MVLMAGRMMLGNFKHPTVEQVAQQDYDSASIGFGATPSIRKRLLVPHCTSTSPPLYITAKPRIVRLSRAKGNRIQVVFSIGMSVNAMALVSAVIPR
jgi:hypothetical protein